MTNTTPTFGTPVTFATGAAVNSTSPDSISIANGFAWVAYHNNADSTGLSGSSTVVQYDPSGNIVHTYSLAGYVDGLKYDPYSGEIWAMQNQDGNSTLTLINPEDNSASAPIPYTDHSMTRGYDDVVFTNGKVFMSYTNPDPLPAGSGESTLVQVLNGNNPHSVLHTKPILTDGVTGLNTATDSMQVVPQNDPDSLKLAPNGDLLFSSGGDGVIIDVHNPGTPQQTIAFTQVLVPDPNNPGQFVSTSSLDDAIKPSASAGTFYLTDTGTNTVLTVHATGLNINDYYASVGSQFGQVDPTTGDFTPLVFGSSSSSFHGAEFVPDANVATSGNPEPAVSVNNDSFTFNPPAGSTAMNAMTNTTQNTAQAQDTLPPDHASAATLTQLLAEAPHSDPSGMTGTDALHQTNLDHGQHNFHLG
jgi:hypothetical protein